MVGRPRKGFGLQLSGPIHSVGTPSGKYIIYSVIICWLICLLIGWATSYEIGMIAGIGLLVGLMAIKGKIIRHVRAKRARSLERMIKR